MIRRHLFSLGIASLLSLIPLGTAPAEANVHLSFGSHPHRVSKSIGVAPRRGVRFSHSFGRAPIRYRRHRINSIPFNSLHSQRRRYHFRSHSFPVRRSFNSFHHPRY